MSDNNIQSAITAGSNLGQPRKLDGFKPYTLVPEGCSVHELAPEPEHPERIVANPQFHDAAGFIEYVKRFTFDKETHIFADVNNSIMIAILDYHVPGPVEGTPQPAYCSHRATYKPQQSEEWKGWMGCNGGKMDQATFAEFIETNITDILKPEGATMLEIASSLHVSRGVEFKSAKRLSDGQTQMVFDEKIDGRAGARGELVIPKDFTVGLRPYLGCSRHPIEARLRYRLADGKLTIWYDLLRPKELLQAAFDALVKRVSDETTLGVLLGQP